MRYTFHTVAGFCAIITAALTISQPALAGFVRPITFPLIGQNHFSDDFGDPRSGGREHLGNDIIAKKMTPVVAARDGVIRNLVIPEASWGYAIYLEDADGWQYRYLHINNDTPGTDDGRGGPENAYAPGLERGTRVTAGQLLGWVGDSGNAESVGAHLHFEMWDPGRTAINPYESLLAAQTPTAPSPAPGGSGGTTVTTTIIVPRGGTLIQYTHDPRVYLLADGIKYHIADEYTFNTLQLSWSAIRILSESEGYRTGVPLLLVPGVTALYEDGTPVVAAQPAPTTRVTFTQELRVGSRGDQVTALQNVLARLGYYRYAITGYFGPITRDAVIAFQRDRGIETVGFTGPKTRAALNAL